MLGLLGAGGIGLILQVAIGMFQWHLVSVILIAIIVVVIFGELVSG